MRGEVQREGPRVDQGHGRISSQDYCVRTQGSARHRLGAGSLQPSFRRVKRITKPASDESRSLRPVNYYRCERWGHLWTTEKDRATALRMNGIGPGALSWLQRRRILSFWPDESRRSTECEHYRRRHECNQCCERKRTRRVKDGENDQPERIIRNRQQKYARPSHS